MLCGTEICLVPYEAFSANYKVNEPACEYYSEFGSQVISIYGKECCGIEVVPPFYLLAFGFTFSLDMHKA